MLFTGHDDRGVQTERQNGQHGATRETHFIILFFGWKSNCVSKMKTMINRIRTVENKLEQFSGREKKYIYIKESVALDTITVYLYVDPDERSVL